ETQTAAAAAAGTIGLHRSGTAEGCAASRSPITGLRAVTSRPAASRPTAECAGAEGRAASVDEAHRRREPNGFHAADSGIRGMPLTVLFHSLFTQPRGRHSGLRAGFHPKLVPWRRNWAFASPSGRNRPL